MPQLNPEQLFDQLRRRGITFPEEQQRKIVERLEKRLSYQPCIGIFGKTGVGKSSLCNALFGGGRDVCKISDIEACTRNPQEVLLAMGTKGIKLIDCPGIGENRERDAEYRALYRKLIPELNLIIWVLMASERAYGPDIDFYERDIRQFLKGGHAPFLIALNQTDAFAGPERWDASKHEPLPCFQETLDRKITVVANCFGVGRGTVIPVSAKDGYNLVQLVYEAVVALPNSQKVAFAHELRPEVKSPDTITVTEKGFWDTVLEVIKEAVPAVIDAVTEVVHELAGKAKGWWHSIWS